VFFDPNAPDGFRVHSFAGDDPIECRDYVRATLGLGKWERAPKQLRSSQSRQRPAEPSDNAGERSTLALRLWHAAGDPRGTIAADYLMSRGLVLSRGIARDVLRFHPALKFNEAFFGAIIALFRDIATDAPCGIHRTFLDRNGRKLGRKMLGRARGAAIKLDANENVTLGLTIGEGVETCIAAYLAGFRPVWALGSATAIAVFPVLSGIQAITVLGEVNDGGANHFAIHQCANALDRSRARSIRCRASSRR
jgi:hypothetical protein